MRYSVIASALCLVFAGCVVQDAPPQAQPPVVVNPPPVIINNQRPGPCRPAIGINICVGGCHPGCPHWPHH